MQKYDYSVFISYSHSDAEWVRNWLLPRLEGAGLRVCIDFRDFEIGKPVLVNIENAVDRSRKILIVLTNSWVRSEWANFESLLVQTDDPLGRRARTIPLLKQQCKPPKRIALLTYIDFTQASEWESQFQRLLTSLKCDSAPGALQANDQDHRMPSALAGGREMLFVPGGSFLLGSEESPDERPPREVEVHPFWIDKFAVTNEDYEVFVAATGYPELSHWKVGRYPTLLPRHPVVHVNWYDAIAYAQWAGKRLPTEMEWEKAARGSDGRRFPWGESFDPLRCNTLESKINNTTEVDRYPLGCSPFGVWDMAGNVWEWTADGYSPRHKALRGGSWNDLSAAARCSARYFLEVNQRQPYVGFRCVWSQ